MCICSTILAKLAQTFAFLMFNVLSIAWYILLEHLVRCLEDRPRIHGPEDSAPLDLSHPNTQSPCNLNGGISLATESLEELSLDTSLPEDTG